jgi:hypothetical protein
MLAIIHICDRVMKVNLKKENINHRDKTIVKRKLNAMEKTIKR